MRSKLSKKEPIPASFAKASQRGWAVVDRHNAKPRGLRTFLLGALFLSVFLSFLSAPPVLADSRARVGQWMITHQTTYVQKPVFSAAQRQQFVQMGVNEADVFREAEERKADPVCLTPDYAALPQPRELESLMAGDCRISDFKPDSAGYSGKLTCDDNTTRSAGSLHILYADELHYSGNWHLKGAQAGAGVETSTQFSGIWKAARCTAP